MSGKYCQDFSCFGNLKNCFCDNFWQMTITNGSEQAVTPLCLLFFNNWRKRLARRKWWLTACKCLNDWGFAVSQFNVHRRAHRNSEMPEPQENLEPMFVLLRHHYENLQEIRICCFSSPKVMYLKLFIFIFYGCEIWGYMWHYDCTCLTVLNYW